MQTQRSLRNKQANHLTWGDLPEWSDNPPLGLFLLQCAVSIMPMAKPVQATVATSGPKSAALDDVVVDRDATQHASKYCVAEPKFSCTCLKAHYHEWLCTCAQLGTISSPQYTVETIIHALSSCLQSGNSLTAPKTIAIEKALAQHMVIR